MTMRKRRFGRLLLSSLLALGAAMPAAHAATAVPADPVKVESNPPGACFVGADLEADCALAETFADDWVLAGAAQDAQIMAAGGVATNPSCGGYYLAKTFVTVYNKATFVATFQPAADGVALVKSSVAVPSGFYAFDIVSAGYDAYGYIAHLYSSNDPQVAGIAAPIYVLTAAPVPRVGPGTMPLPADERDRWIPPTVMQGSGEIVVFDTSTDPLKMDLAPADGWLDATAGHATFIDGLVAAAYSGPHSTVDATARNGLLTEAAMATALASHKFSGEDVANLSAGTYACKAGDHTIYPLLLADAVARLDVAGVHLVAAAGNDATDQEFYPAAWGVDPTPAYRAKCPTGTLYREPFTNLCMIDRADAVTSVGSVIESKVMVTYSTPKEIDRSEFSNYGNWVEAWAVGERLVSDYPGGAYSYCVPTQSGWCEAPGQTTVVVGEAPSSHLGSVVKWEGTSFAAPQVAAWIAGGNAAP